MSEIAFSKGYPDFTLAEIPIPKLGHNGIDDEI
jgi:hypothetical protein